MKRKERESNYFFESVRARENNLMALEDQDVKSEYEEEGESEDSDY